MKITLIRTKGKNEVYTRYGLEEVAHAIKTGWRKHTVTHLREVYQLMTKERQADGQILTNWEGGIKLERICFAQEFDKYKESRRVLGYNGLVVIEVNNLPTYEKAVETRDQAKKMPETLMTFLGASGKSVKIVCRGELFRKEDGRGMMADGRLPKNEADIRQFHKNLYQTARRAYMNQFGFDIEYLEPRLDRTVYVSADPEMGFNPEARPFYADTEQHDVPQTVSISRESDLLMPGRTVKRTYRLEWLFIVDTTLGHYFELPDEDRLETLLMQIATRCLNQGIPLAFAQGMTMEHPALNTDELLLKKTFETVYAV
ncbi:MAG: hypothetical protein IKP52_07560, partial [Prevotella sp.]|nr:hypothetical protein [Prevotella sp.]